MSQLVDPSVIETIVGVQRHPDFHYGRVVTEEDNIYILHSQSCLDSGIDLRQCEVSLALDNRVNLKRWEGHTDIPVRVLIDGDNRLVPVVVPE